MRHASTTPSGALERVLITSTAAGIGAAIAGRCRAEGYLPVVSDRMAMACRTACARRGPHRRAAVGAAADPSADPGDCRRGRGLATAGVGGGVQRGQDAGRLLSHLCGLEPVVGGCHVTPSGGQCGTGRPMVKTLSYRLSDQRHQPQGHHLHGGRAAPVHDR